MERVLSDGVTGSQAQCFIDLTTISEDLAYSASLPSLHSLPPPGCVARDQHPSPPASLLQRRVRSTVARAPARRLYAPARPERPALGGRPPLRPNLVGG